MSKYDFSAFDSKNNYDFSAFDNEPGIPQTVLGKLANGGSLGFVDEVSGVLEAAGQAVGVKGIGGKIKDVGFTENGPTLDFNTLKQAYVQGRDKERTNQDSMSEAHPVVAGVSDLVGSLATVPVSGAATLGGRAAAAAGMGAVAGLGSSQADLTKGDYMGAATDTAIGGALGGALQYGGEKYVAPAMKKVGKWIADSGPTKIIGKTLASIVPENTERYLSRTEKVNSALEMEDVGQYFKDDALKQFQEHLGNLDTEAWKSLKTDATLNKNDILKIGEDYVNQIIGGKNNNLTRVAGTGADADKIKAIYQQLDEIKNAFGNNISESDLKSVVQNLQKLGYSLEGSPRSSLQGQGLRELSGIYNDALKSINPAYAEKMIPVQEATSTMQSLERQFINNQAPDQLDKFLLKANKFNTLSDESEALKAVRGLDKATGTDVENMIKDRLTANSFQKADTNGARKTLAGGVVGSALGGTLGGAIGSAAGYSMDKYAGQVFKGILNMQISATDGIQKIAPYLGKFAKPLIEAAKRGSTAVSATHFLLQQQHPEYRQIMQKIDEGK